MWTNAPLAAAYQANLEHARPPRRSTRRRSRQRQHRHGQRQQAGAVDPPDDRHRPAARRPAHAGVRPVRRRRDGQRGVVDGAKALAMTGIDVLCTPALLDAMRAAFDGAQGRRCASLTARFARNGTGHRNRAQRCADGRPGTLARPRVRQVPSTVRTRAPPSPSSTLLLPGVLRRCRTSSPGSAASGASCRACARRR